MQNYGKLVYSILYKSRSCSCPRIISSGIRILYNSYNTSLTLYDVPKNASSSLLDNLEAGKIVELTTLTNILDNLDFDIVSKNEAASLVKCCEKAFLKSSLSERNQFTSKLYGKLLKWPDINLDVLHAYLKLCSKNFIPVNSKVFLSSLTFEPNHETYNLLFENVCNQGNFEEALTLLELMKTKQVPVVEETFNNLVLVYTIHGGVAMAESVLATMKSAHIPETNATILAIYKGLLKKRNYKEFKDAVVKYPIRLKEEEFLSLIEYLGIFGDHSLLTEIEHLYKHIDITRTLQNKVENVCIHLVYMGQPRSAMVVYQRFVPPVANISYYGQVILQEMLKNHTDTQVLISLAKDLRDKNVNDYILENLTEYCLRNGLEKQAWALMETLNVKCHYFWPLFVIAGKNHGETGVFSVLRRMKNFKVNPDLETFEDYIFPFCDLTNINLLIARLKKENISVRELLSPLMICLLKQKRVKEVSDLCRTYGVSSLAKEIYILLPNVWKIVQDNAAIVNILQKYYEITQSQNDIVGEFLIDSLKNCVTTEDFQKFYELIKVVNSKPWKVSFESGDKMIHMLQNCSDENLKMQIRDIINLLIDITVNLSTKETSVLHPRHMGLKDLECHLVELQEKHMETRGVIRKLISFHARAGNFERVTELRNQFLRSGYIESPGMKSIIMHSFVQGGYLEEAMNIYEDIKTNHSKFALDSFKCIDLAQLLVDNSRFEEAVQLMKSEVNKFEHINHHPIQRNCWRLLKSYKDEDQQKIMFEVLLKSGLCKPTNVILGALIRIHLNSGDLNKAVEKYIKYSKKFKCTPLQREVMSALTQSEKTELLEKVMVATQQVHGTGPAQVGLISALAENGQIKPLRKVLMQTETRIRPLLEKQCERWVQEKRLEPLLALSKVPDRFPDYVFNLDFVYKCILDAFGFNNDASSALSFFESIPEEYSTKPELQRKLAYVLKKCNRNVPDKFKIGNRQ